MPSDDLLDNPYAWFKEYIEEGNVDGHSVEYITRCLDDWETGSKHVGHLSSDEAQEYKRNLDQKIEEAHEILERAYNNWLSQEYGEEYKIGNMNGGEFMEKWASLPEGDSKIKGVHHVLKSCDWHGGLSKIIGDKDLKWIKEDESDE